MYNKKKIVINGKFFSQQITGVQRYAREVLVELDLLVTGLDVEIALPENIKNVPVLHNIKKHTIKGNASIFWEQIKLPIYIFKQKAIGLHFCHIAPILKPDVVCIHDANVARNHQWFTQKLILWYSLIHKFCAKYAKNVLTVSNFSKQELHEIFAISAGRIKNVGSGWQHILRISENKSILLKNKLEPKRYFFSLGTQAPHKNIKWIYEVAKRNPSEQFVLSGSFYGKVFKKEDLTTSSNVHFLGYLSDEEVKALMIHCKAFLFPSFYEGFGLPPLEALCVGSQIVVSDIPVMREIFEDSAHYIDPQNSRVDLNAILEKTVALPEKILEKYSWKRTAENILEVLKEI